VGASIYDEVMVTITQHKNNPIVTVIDWTDSMMTKFFSAVITILLLGGVAFQLQQSEASGTTCLETPYSDVCHAGLPKVEYELLRDEMFMNPVPDVRPIPLNDREMTRYAYRRLTGEGGTTYYNAPGGAAIGAIDPGFTFIKVINYQDGWVEFEPGKWVPEGVTAVARPSTFAGVELTDTSFNYEMAWVLIPSFPAPYPGASQDTSLPRLERYTRVNIFATVEVDGWRWYLVDDETWIIQTSVAKVQFVDPPADAKGHWIAVDLYEQVLVAYEDTQPVFATLISSGLADWPTREGTFTSYWRLTNGYMTGSEGQSNYYLVDGVPYTIYFDEAISLHGTYWHDSFGYRHSRGCVNLSIMDSEWIFSWTGDSGYEYPIVHVFSSGEYVNG